jgi:hypothetical protein
MNERFANAQLVDPNAKCSGCMNYDPQLGGTGACLVGLRPWLCGDGTTPTTGYAPMTMQVPSISAPMAFSSQVDAPTGADVAPPELPLVVLGEEHVQLVHQLEAQEVTLQKSLCPTHSRVAANGQTSHYVAGSYEGLRCACSPVSDFAIAKSMTQHLANRELALISAPVLLDFVHRNRKV